MEKLTKKLFLAKANMKFPFPKFDYDYSETEFQKSTDRIYVYCNKHKLRFTSTTASSFLAGRICPECLKELRAPKENEKQLQKQKEFLKRCKEKGLDKLFDLSETEYVNIRTPIIVRCLTCGKQLNPIYPNNFLGGYCGCNNCKKKQKMLEEKNEFIQEAQKIHIDENGIPKFDYSLVNYKNKSIDTVLIRCIKHDLIFEQTPFLHLQSKHCCPECKKENISEIKILKTSEFIERAKKIHVNPDGTPKYDYSITECFGAQYYLDYICPIHGVKSQKAETHLQGHGCDECGKISYSLKQSKTTEQFIQEAKAIHDPIRKMLNLPSYVYDNVIYNGSHNLIDIYCPVVDENGNQHGYFSQAPYAHLAKQGCPICNGKNGFSLAEKEIVDFIKSIYSGEIIENSRKIIPPKELDIYLPEKKIAIEYDGFYYHSGNVKPNNYHYQKTLDCEKKGIQLIHIFENEWINTPEIVKYRLINILGKIKLKIRASKCCIKEVLKGEEQIFLDNHHLQGYAASSICYGLYYTYNGKEYLVSLMSFVKPRFNKNYDWEILRFCNLRNFNVYGGASKLFKYFIDKFKPNSIISYADRRWSIHSENNLYSKLGFKLIENKTFGYWYIDKNKKLIHRSVYTKEKCKKLGCSDTMSEKEFVTKILGYNIIYDCGQLKYIWK